MLTNIYLFSIWVPDFTS